MNKKLILLISIILTVCCKFTFGQSAVGVNPLTGAANVVIPVYDLHRGAVDCPINLVYNSSGIKPKDVEETAGMGWQLLVGGSVSRQVRGLPDDAYQDNLGNKNLVGWLYNSTGAASITSFTPVNTGTGVNCTNETTDISYINSHFANTSDTEPDLFTVSAPGLSCQLYYDVANAKFVTVPYQDLSITFATDNNTSDATYRNITSFTITNDQGIKYVFSVPESVTQKAVTTTTVNFFQTAYNQYKNGINFYDNWFLSKMTDANGNGIIFNYTAANPRPSVDPVQLYLYSGSAYAQQTQYQFYNTVIPQVLTSIQTIALNQTPQIFTLNWVYGSSSQTTISSITGQGKSLLFSYSNSLYTGAKYTRAFLTEFSDQQGICSSPIDYKFTYNGVTGTTTTLPDSTSTQVDYWGYYSTLPNNGSLMPEVFATPANTNANHPYQVCAGSTNAGYSYTIPGTNRAADASVIATGQLSTVTYALGGTSTITYEPNDFYDPLTSTVEKGGGVRVKQITDYDGINTANNILRNYTYTDASGNSTGKPVTLPEYAFTIPYSGSATGLALAENSTVLSAIDLSEEDHTIMYGNVTLSQATIGKTTYQYYLTAMNWDKQGICSSCSTADWLPTTNLAARTNCTPLYGPINNNAYSYPFTPNANYDFERGLPQSVISYDNSNNKVSETDYTYSRTGTPHVITAFRFDKNTNVNTIEAYAKYTINTLAGELTAQAVKTLYNSSAPVSSTTSYLYGTVQHKLAQQRVANSDGSTQITNIKYVKDYTVSAGSSDVNVAAIYSLQGLNINAPVETYQQTQTGVNIFTTGAALTLFKSFTENGNTFYLPSQQLKFSVPAGASSFQPFAITSNVKSYDAGYLPAANFTSYDDFGILLTMDDAHKNEQTVVTDHNSYLPVAVFKNAAMGEFAYNDFDSAMPIPNPAFTYTGTPWGTPVGGHTGIAYGLSSSQTITTTVNRNPQAHNYIFSVWINSAAAGSLHFSFVSASQTLTYTKAYTATSGTWQYYEWKLAVNATDPTIAATITNTTNIGIDDIMFYPENAEVTTNAYDSYFHKIATTNTNGVSAYFNYDEWGRLLTVYDQDKNIVQKKAYVTPADKQNFANANSFTISGGTINFKGEFMPNSAITLTAATPPSCYINGITYTWHFSDASDVVTTTPTLSHSFTTTGSKTISVTMSSPYFGQQITTPQTISVTTNLYFNTDNPTTGGTGFDDVDFYQGSTLVYHFTQATIALGNSSVPQGVYTIVVTAHGSAYIPHTGAGYSSITLSQYETPNILCLTHSSTGSYTFSSVDMSTWGGFGFTMNQTNCP